MSSRRSFALLALALAGASVPLVSAREERDQPVIEASKSHLDFRHGKTLFTRYHVGEKVAKPYFFPVNALDGVGVTRAWPMEDDPEVKKGDHVHQKSLWFCHGDVIPEGLDYKKYGRDVAGIDFWAEGKGHGKIVCVKVEKPTQAENHASVVTRNEWRTAEGQKVLDETRTIHYFHAAPGANLLVFDIDLAANDYPITFADTKEGSFGLRVRESLRGDKKGVLTNAEGKTGGGKGDNKDKKGCWGLVSAWCDYSGPAGPEGPTAGVAIFADPKNPIDTAWHARDYGLLAANPFGRAKHSKFPDRAGNDEPVKLKKGEHLRLIYGVYVHKGDAKEAKVADAYSRFAKLSASARNP